VYFEVGETGVSCYTRQVILHFLNNRQLQRLHRLLDGSHTGPPFLPTLQSLGSWPYCADARKKCFLCLRVFFVLVLLLRVTLSLSNGFRDI
jgi:hypothetical protein